MKIKYRLIFSFLIISIRSRIMAYYELESNDSIKRVYDLTPDQTFPVIKALKDLKFTSRELKPKHMKFQIQFQEIYLKMNIEKNIMNLN